MTPKKTPAAPDFDEELAVTTFRVKRKHLVALRLAVEVGQDPTPWVTNAREVGQASWAEIGPEP